MRPLLAADLRRRTHRRLHRHWDARAPRGQVVISNPARFVLRTEHPSGGTVYVKARAKAGSLAREVRILRLVAEAGVAPEVTDHLQGSPEIVVSAEAPGAPLSELDDDASWARTGRALRSLHDIAPPDAEAPSGDVAAADWGNRCADGLERTAGLNVELGLGDAAVVEAAAGWAVEVLRSHPPELTLVHNDCMPKHVRVDGDRCRFLDFDVAGIGDPRFDLAVLTTFRVGRLGALVDGYGASLTDGLREVVDAHRIRRLVEALHWNAVHGYRLSSVSEALGETAERLGLVR